MDRLGARTRHKGPTGDPGALFRLTALAFAICLGPPACSPPPTEEPTPEPALEATGFFHTAERAGRHWLVDPEGRPFYSTGINHASTWGYIDQDTGRCNYCEAVDAKYESPEDWAETAAQRLESWGFNTVGAWSKWELFTERMPYTVILNLSGANWETGDVPDYFAPEFEQRCADIAAETVAPRAEDPMLLGWFLDNELRWGRDHRHNRTLLEDYLALEEGSPGLAVARQYEDDPTGFLSVLADRYFKIATEAVRAADPNHLLLGVRSISVMTPPEVPAAAAPYLDVYSVNHYIFLDGIIEASESLYGPVMSVQRWLRAYHTATDLPLLITEFSFRAADSGLPNSWPPIYPVLDTQEDRADHFEDYANKCFDAGYIVGHHWFAWVDEPPGGRFDGEDSNFGLVDNDDEVWEVLTARMAEAHARAPHLLPEAPEGAQ